MQSDKIDQGVQDLVNRLTSLDPVEYNSAVNIYFDPSVVFQNGPIVVRGATRYKKLLNIPASICQDSQLVAKPKWDEKRQTITTASVRTVVGPKLPSWVPLHQQIASLSFKMKEPIVLHLNPVQEDGKDLYYVTKVVSMPLPAKNVPFVGYAIEHIAGPILSYALLALATLLGFFHRHPLSEGILPLIVAAIYEGIHATAAFLQDISSRQIAVTERWQKDNGIDMKDMVSKARSTALETQQNLEARARSAGIPVDEYKQKAGALYEDARTKATELAKQAETYARNQAAQKAPTHEAAKHDAPVNDSVEARPGIISSTELAPLGKGIFQDDGKTSNDSDSAHDITNTGPRTPLGGHNPLAENAFSYAAAVQE